MTIGIVFPSRRSRRLTHIPHTFFCLVFCFTPTIVSFFSFGIHVLLSYLIYEYLAPVSTLSSIHQIKFYVRLYLWFINYMVYAHTLSYVHESRGTLIFMIRSLISSHTVVYTIIMLVSFLIVVDGDIEAGKVERAQEKIRPENNAFTDYIRGWIILRGGGGTIG